MALDKITLRYPPKDRLLYQQLQHIKEKVNAIVDWSNTLDVSGDNDLVKVNSGGTPDYLSDEHFERTQTRHIRLRNRAFRHGMLSHLNVIGDHPGYLVREATRTLTADWDAGSYYIQATRFISDVTTGTAPFSATSTTKCTNLNAEQVDGADLIDEDNMASDSDVHFPTQQSVVAYVGSLSSIYAPISSAFVTIGADGTLTAERALTASTGITITDGGANSTVSISTNDGEIHHGGLLGLADDDHTQYIKHALSTASNDFLVGSGSNTWVKKTLAETGAILEGDIDHDNLVGFVGAEHLSLPNTIANVLSDHNLAAHTGLGLFDQSSDVDHDATTNFLASEHFLQTAITNVSTALSTGLLKVTTGTGALSVITDSSTNWDAAYTHISSNGTDHGYIDQDLQTSASPAFAACSLGTGELTCGSINRASGQLTIEAGGTNILNVQAAGVGVFGTPSLTGLELNHTASCYIGCKVDSDADATGFRFMRSGGVAKDCTWYFYVPANQTYFSFYESAEQFRFYPTGELRFHGFDTEVLTMEDAGSAGATEQDWIEVTVGGATGYIRVFAAK